MAAIAELPQKTRKKLVRRTDHDYSQRLRHGVQFAFLVLNLWIAVQFWLFVRYFESGGLTLKVSHPPGVEGWLPIAALMNLKATLLTGRFPEIHPAGLFLLVAFLGISLVFRKAFCGWLCPVGTVSEYLWRLGARIFGRNHRLPRKIDLSLRGLKYLLLGFFVYVIATMPVDALLGFLQSPYGLLADVKMLNFFRFMSATAALMILVLVLGSVVIQNFWCRYLCPYGALMGLVSLMSPVRIRRTESTCIDCGKCAKACPAALPVDKLVTIRSAECMACLECVAACPADNTLAPVLVSQRKLPAWAFAAGIALIFFGVVGYAQLTGHWKMEIPRDLYFDLVPRASQLSHPGL